MTASVWSKVVEVMLERPRVGGVAEPGAERLGLLGGKPLVADGIGELEDRLRPQSAVEMVVQQRLGGAAQSRDIVLAC